MIEALELAGLSKPDNSHGALEHVPHEENSRLPAFVKGGLIHVEFGTIHPPLDGKGCLGRQLVKLRVRDRGGLPTPPLSQSLFRKSYLARYHRLLRTVPEHDDREAWLGVFLTGVPAAANHACDAATRIVDRQGRPGPVHADRRPNPGFTTGSSRCRS